MKKNEKTGGSSEETKNKLQKEKTKSSRRVSGTVRRKIDPEEREQRLVDLAIDLAEKQLREGTASAQVITHYLKLGSSKEQLEREMLSEQVELAKAKTENLRSAKRIEDLYADALSAMKKYSGEDKNE